MRSQHQALADYLSEVLGVKVELIVGASYLDLVERLIRGDLDIAILPPATYALARAKSTEVKLLASQIAGGATSYSSYIVVARTSPYEELEELVGRRISFVDEASASGFILPWSAFLDHGIEPRTAFSSIRFAGNHVDAIADVLEGRADAAATYSGMLDYTRRAGTASPDAANLRILHKAGRVPYDALCGSPSLKAAVALRFADAFMSIDTSSSRGRRIYAATTNHVSGWAHPEEGQYRGILETMERVKRHRSGKAGGSHVH